MSRDCAADNSEATTIRDAGGRHRTKKPRRTEPYVLLGAGALSLGIGAAALAGAGVASADEAGSERASASASDSSESSSESPAARSTAPSVESDDSDEATAGNVSVGRVDEVQSTQRSGFRSTSTESEPEVESVVLRADAETPLVLDDDSSDLSEAATAEPPAEKPTKARTTVNEAAQQHDQPVAQLTANSPAAPGKSSAASNVAAAAAPGAVPALSPIAALPFGPSVPYHLVASPTGDRAYAVSMSINSGSSIPTGLVWGINTTTNTLVGPATTVGYVPINGLATSAKPIVFSPNGKRVYVSSATYDSNGSLSSVVTVFDAASGQPIGVPIALGRTLGAAGLVVSPDGRRLYSSNADGTLSIVDLEHGNAPLGSPITLGSVPGVGGPAADIVVATNQAQTVYVTDWAEQVIHVLHAAGTSAADPISVDGSPISIVLTPDSRYLVVSSIKFAATGGTANQAFLTVIDTAKNIVIGDPISYGDPSNAPATTGALAISADGRYAYAPSTSMTGAGASVGALWKVDLLTGTAKPMPVIAGAFVISSDGRWLYAATGTVADSKPQGSVVAIDTGTDTVVSSSPLSGTSAAQNVAIAPAGNRLYVSAITVAGTDVSSVQGGITVLDTSTGNVATRPTVVQLIQRAYVQVKSVVVAVVRTVRNVVATLVNAALKPIGLLQSPKTVDALYKRLRLVTNDNNPNGIHVDRISAPDGDRYIVYLGGTVGSLIPGPLQQAWWRNWPAYKGELKSNQINILYRALTSAGVDKTFKSPVMLVGFSQGGLDAQNIAEQTGFNVTTVVTFGAPVIYDAPTDYRILHVQADGDPVWSLAGVDKPNELSSNVRAGNVYRVRTANYNQFASQWWNPVWGGALHGDETTYVQAGQQFQKNSQSQASYRAVISNINKFTGSITKSWYSQRASGFRSLGR